MLWLKLIHFTEGGATGGWISSTAYWPQFIPDYWFCWIIIHVSPIKDIVISRIGNGHSTTHPKLSGPDCIQEESCLLLCFIFPSPPLGDDCWSLLREVRTMRSGTNKNIYCDIMSAVSVTYDNDHDHYCHYYCIYQNHHCNHHYHHLHRYHHHHRYRHY